MSQKDLNTITDKVLAYDPDAPTGPLKVIAGAPDRPLVIGDIEIPCYVLEDETRVLTQRGMVSALGMARGGSSYGGGDRLAHFVGQKTLKPFVNKELLSVTVEPVKFKPSTGALANSYPATLLVDICSVVLLARDAGVLGKQQLHIADRCDSLIRGFAKVGIIALVDEATGYQRIREERALATILERLIAKELSPWTRTFEFEFYQQICRLKKWPSIRAIKRPSIVGTYTNDFVYERLAPGVLEELQRKNPTLPDAKWRRHKHHQWLTPEVGHPKLRQHVWAVVALMRAAPSWNVFKRNLDRAFPKQNTTVPLNLTDPEE